MKKHFLMALIVCLISSACTDDLQEDAICQKESTQTSTQDYKLTEADAVNVALQSIATIEDTKTRSAQRRVHKVEPLGTQSKTRSGEQDTLLYLINFDDNQGFALVSADRRGEPVYAMSDTGKLEITEENADVMGALIEGAKQDVINKTMGVGGGPFIPTGPGFDPNSVLAEVILKVDPLLTEKQSKISPYDKYSSKCRNSKGQPALSNYAAVAIEKIMVCSDWPESLYNINLTDDRYANNGDYSDETITAIIEILGRDEFLNLQYMDNNQLAIGEDHYIPYALQNLGFSSHDGFYNFYEAKSNIIDLLTYHRPTPALMKAGNSKTQTQHVWLLDGVVCYKVRSSVSIIGQPDRYTYSNMYHCNWGFKDGDCNGYYFENLYGFIGKPYTKADYDNSNNQESSNIYFDDDIVCIWNLYTNRDLVSL